MSVAWIDWLGHRLPPCNEIAERISDSLDRTLTVRQRIELWLHLRICEFCRRYARQLGFLEMGIRRLKEESDHPTHPTALSSSSREKMKAAIREQAG